LQKPHWEEACGLSHHNHHSHHGKHATGVKRFMHGLFPFVHSNWNSGDCACQDTCGEHLNEEICQPCDGPSPLNAPPADSTSKKVAFFRGHMFGHNSNAAARSAVCVRNPMCGLGRRWCRVSPHCKAPFVHVVNVRGCHGPHPHHPACEAAINHRMAGEKMAAVPDHIIASISFSNSNDDFNNANATMDARKQHVLDHIQRERHRCSIQESEVAAGVCPAPQPEELSAASAYIAQESLTRVRSCYAPPSMASFVRHFIDKLPVIAHDMEVTVERVLDHEIENHAIAAPPPAIEPPEHAPVTPQTSLTFPFSPLGGLNLPNSRFQMMHALVDGTGITEHASKGSAVWIAGLCIAAVLLLIVTWISVAAARRRRSAGLPCCPFLPARCECIGRICPLLASSNRRRHHFGGTPSQGSGNLLDGEDGGSSSTASTSLSINKAAARARARP
jgi:hypothetical protein